MTYEHDADPALPDYRDAPVLTESRISDLERCLDALAPATIEICRERFSARQDVTMMREKTKMVAAQVRMLRQLLELRDQAEAQDRTRHEANIKYQTVKERRQLVRKIRHRKRKKIPADEAPKKPVRITTMEDGTPFSPENQKILDQYYEERLAIYNAALNGELLPDAACLPELPQEHTVPA